MHSLVCRDCSGYDDRSDCGTGWFVADAASVGTDAGSIRYGGVGNFTQTEWRFWFFEKGQVRPSGGRKNVLGVREMIQECGAGVASSPARLAHSIQLEAKLKQNVDFWRKWRARVLFMTHTSVEENIFSSEGG